MLSGETAVGAYPVEAVETMARIACSAEGEMFGYEKWFDDGRKSNGEKDDTDAIAEAVATIAHDRKAKAIICSTSSGATARTLSKFKPRCPILAATSNPRAEREMAVSWGVCPLTTGYPADTDEMIENAVNAAVAAGHVHAGDLVVITAGTPVGVPGSTNLIKVHKVGEPLKQPAAPKPAEVGV